MGTRRYDTFLITACVMKGIIFTSFVEFADQQLGGEFVEQMLVELPLDSHGAYTNVGTYPVGELLEMVKYILARHDLDAAALQRAFGKFTFGKLAERYPELVAQYADGLQCIFEVDQNIHKSVRKLYPDAELPDLQARVSDDGRRLDLVYRSSRPFMHLAHGLIEGCLAHYGTPADITMEDHSNGTGTHASFVLRRND